MSSLPERVRHALIKRGGPLLAGAGCILALGVAASPAAARPWGGAGQWGHGHRAAPLIPGNLLLATSDYAPADIQAGVTQLPPECNIATPPDCATAVAGGTYPFSFNNDSIDAFFGITSPVNLDELTPWGQHIGTIPVPDDDLVTSFSSKSELALNLSPRGQVPVVHRLRRTAGRGGRLERQYPGRDRSRQRDVGPYYRVVAQLDRWRQLDLHRDQRLQRRQRPGGDRPTTRRQGPAVHGRQRGQRQSNPQPTCVVLGAARRSSRRHPCPRPTRTQASPTPVGSFNITQLGDKPDKVGKDDNFRGLDDLQQRPLLHQGQRRQRRQHRVLRRHHGQGVPERRRAAGARARSCRPRRLALRTSARRARPTGLGPATCASCKGFPTTLGQGPIGRDRRSRSGCGSPTRTRCTSPTRAAATTPTRTASTPTRPRPTTDAGLQKWVFDRPPAVEARLHAPERAEPRSALHGARATRPGINSGAPGCRGRRPPTACATSPAGSTRTAR